MSAIAQCEATLRRSSLGLADALSRVEATDSYRYLVVVDQFEELFRFDSTTSRSGDDDGATFVRLLIEATRSGDAPVDVLVTMRSDFLGDCSRFRELPETINSGLYLVPRLTRIQLDEAITAPIAVGGATITPRLVQRLLNDAGADPDVLPVLQHALMRTWDLWAQDGASGPIDLEHYEESGGLEDALSRHADEAYYGLEDGANRTIAEAMFKRLTELGVDGREVRRPTPLVEIAAVADTTPDAVRQIIAQFEGQGRSFVNVSGDEIVDISHESLIRQWPRLQSWVRHEAESRELYLRLADGAGRWERGEAALLRDPDLQIAVNWWNAAQPNRPWAERYEPEFERAASYLDASKHAARRRRQGALAAIATLILLTIVSVVLAAAAIGQRNTARTATAEAQRQQRTATSRQLAAQSLAEGAGNRALSLLTAIEALRSTETDGLRLPVAQHALRSAVAGPLSRSVSDATTGGGHLGPVKAVAFSPDGSMLATGGDDAIVLVWNMADPRAEPRRLDRHNQPITSLAFSPDGNWLATGSDDATAVLWDLRDPAAGSIPLMGHADAITTLAFSPDGSRLATGSNDTEALLWSLDDPSGLVPDPERLQGHVGFVLSLAFSPDGTHLVTGGGDEVALVWAIDDVAAAPLILGGHDDDVTAVAFGPDGEAVATASKDFTVSLWDLTDAATASDVLRHRAPVNTLAFSPDGRWLATGGGDLTARLWDLDHPLGPNADPTILRHRGIVEAVTFAADGRWLATGSRDNTARLFDLNDLAAEPIVLGGHEASITTLDLRSDGRWLATGSDDGRVRLWDLDDLETRPLVLHHDALFEDTRAEVTALAFTTDGRQLVTGTSDKTVRKWDLDDVEPVPAVFDHERILDFENAGVTALAVSPDGRLIATGSGDQIVRLWNAEDPAAVPVDLDHDAFVSGVAFSPDGRWLAVSVKADVAWLWDLRNLAVPPRALRGHEDELSSVAFSPDSEWLATGSWDRTVLLWRPDDLATDPVRLEAHEDSVTSLAFTADGRRLATGGRDDSARIWSLDSDEPRVEYRLATGAAVTGTAFSPDGEILATSAGESVQLWDLTVPDPEDPIANPAVLADHDGVVNAVVFSPDGKRFASGGADETARVWLRLDELTVIGCAAAGRNLTQSEWQEFVPELAYRKTCEQWPEGP